MRQYWIGLLIFIFFCAAEFRRRKKHQVSQRFKRRANRPFAIDTHARGRVACKKAAGLKVYDDRELRSLA